jgi:hypothetical protein
VNKKILTMKRGFKSMQEGRKERGREGGKEEDNGISNPSFSI